jgi:hypothetical protein
MMMDFALMSQVAAMYGCSMTALFAIGSLDQSVIRGSPWGAPV